MNEEERAHFRQVLQDRLQPAGRSSITLTGRAHAIQGKVLAP